jgi:hypothetical protein
MLERVGYLAVFNLIGCLHPNEDGKPCTHRDVATFWPEEVRRVDWIGYALFTEGVVLFYHYFFLSAPKHLVYCERTTQQCCTERFYRLVIIRWPLRIDSSFLDLILRLQACVLIFLQS